MSLKEYTLCNVDMAYEQLTPFHNNVAGTSKNVFPYIANCFRRERGHNLCMN